MRRLRSLALGCGREKVIAGDEKPRWRPSLCDGHVELTAKQMTDGQMSEVEGLPLLGK